MRIGLGLPNAIPGVSAATVLDFARQGEELGFATLATTDRLVYDGYESLTLLGAVAAVTSRARLTTSVLVAPLRSNTALLAKQAATVDQLSEGRLALGLSVGARPDDFRAGGVEHAGRGKRFDEQLDELKAIWSGARRGFAGAIGPAPTEPGGPELVLGGHSPAAIRRVVRRGTGWIGGGGGAGMFAAGAQAVRAAWTDAGRAGAPRLVGLAYVAVGPTAERDANAYLRDYYGFAPPYADLVVRGAGIGEAGVRTLVNAYRSAGCDELILAPCSADLGLLPALAEVAGTREEVVV